LGDEYSRDGDGADRMQRSAQGDTCGRRRSGAQGRTELCGGLGTDRGGYGVLGTDLMFHTRDGKSG